MEVPVVWSNPNTWPNSWLAVLRACVEFSVCAELSSQENASVSDSHILKDGNWNIHFPLVIDDTQLKTFDINDTNTYLSIKMF